MENVTVGALARAKKPGVRLRVVARGGEIRVVAHYDGGVITARAPFLALPEVLLAVLATMREVRS